MKYILMDDGALTITAINLKGSLVKQKIEKKISSETFIAPSSYNYVNMIISTLSKIGVEKDDVVIFCREGKSWRKALDSSYKANRAKMREDQHHIDWPYEFDVVNKVIDQLQESTPFHWVRDWILEADDLIAESSRLFFPNKCIIVSKDADLEMLCARENVLYFSLNIKSPKGGKGFYKFVENPYQVLQKKIDKGDVSDNIIVPEIDTPEDRALRTELIDLLNLPKFVQEAAEKILLNLQPKEPHWDKLPFPNSLGKRFLDIYKKDKIIEPDYCKELLEKRHKRKLKIAKEKRHAKKKELAPLIDTKE